MPETQATKARSKLMRLIQAYPGLLPCCAETKQGPHVAVAAEASREKVPTRHESRSSGNGKSVPFETPSCADCFPAHVENGERQSGIGRSTLHQRISRGWQFVVDNE